MINQSLTKKILVLLFVLNVVLVASFAFIFSKVKSSEAQTAKIYSQIGIDQQGKQALKDLQQNVQSTQGERTQLASYFVNENNIVGFLQQIESLGKPSGAKVKLTSVNKHSSKNASDNYLEISADASGSFRQVFDFITLLQNLPYKLHFTQVSIQKNNTGNTKTPSAQTSFFQKTNQTSNLTNLGTNMINAASSSASNVTTTCAWKATVTFDLESFGSLSK
jgi:Tfp pilus assembly protein PilO